MKKINKHKQILKSTLVILFYCHLHNYTISQTYTTFPQWTWVTGSNVLIKTAQYGTIGIAASTNYPGARWTAMNWIDNQGNLWLFGGEGWDGHDDDGDGRNNDGIMNDLWKYDVATNTWTWVKGSDHIEQFGVYGEKGVSAVDNVPGARSRALCWTGKDGTFWLFGGLGYGEGNPYGFGMFNDLWNFNPNTNQWTWVSGSNLLDQKAIIGVQGEADALNMPGARSDAQGWIDNDGNLWIYGGDGYFSDQRTALTDLWKFDVNIKQWTWVKGISEITPIWGDKGIPSVDNNPADRINATCWTDSNNDLWLYGGQNYDDLWKFDVSLKQWIWTSGNNSYTLNMGDYGILGTPSNSNHPGSRQFTPGITDKNGNFWLLGGFYSSGSPQELSRSDVWKYNPLTNQWTWMKGPSLVNQYGFYGVASQTSEFNTPGSRWGGMIWYDQLRNRIWIFGGAGMAAMGPPASDYLGDLWYLDINGY